MTEFIRTPEDNFESLPDFKFQPNYHEWQDLRMHYLDEGPEDAPVMLLLHGMPTWSYLYRDFIGPLTKAGYRCIAPDHFGFGRSDKPTDIHWYTIARHTEVLTSLITKLDLNKITLVCQDWGGPTGLAQAAMMPDRFERLIIMNTWLHHDGYEYSEGITRWNANWHDGGLFAREKPDIALLLLTSAGLIDRDQFIQGMVKGEVLDLSEAAKKMYDGYHAPIKGLSDEAFNGFRRFPLSIPLDSYENGNAAAQELHYRSLLAWNKKVDFIWGIEDDVFTTEWGKEWSNRMNGSFTPISGAGHFLQNTHANEVVACILENN